MEGDFTIVKGNFARDLKCVILIGQIRSRDSVVCYDVTWRAGDKRDERGTLSPIPPRYLLPEQLPVQYFCESSFVRVALSLGATRQVLEYTLHGKFTSLVLAREALKI